MRLVSRLSPFATLLLLGAADAGCAHTVVVSQSTNQAPVITSPLTDIAIVGTPYSYTLTATGTPATTSFTTWW